MEPDYQNVLVETIYDHLSTRRKSLLASGYQQIVSTKTPSAWRLDEVWNRLVHRMLTDEKKGILAPAKGREREAIMRVAGLYQRLLKGDEPIREEWEAGRRACDVENTPYFLRPWRVYAWLIVTVVAIGFAVAYCFPIVKGWALIAGLIAWWSAKKVNLADTPVRASRLRILAARKATDWLARHPEEQCLMDLASPDESDDSTAEEEWEDYTAMEEWMAGTLTIMAEAAAATSAASWSDGGLLSELPDSDESAGAQRDYWNWLSKVLVQILRESSAASIPAAALGN
jgi:hypothetical protein